MASHGVRALADLGPRITLAPERYREEHEAANGVPLSNFVREVRERLALHSGDRAVVLDTTHVKDGLIDLGAARARALPVSAKWRVPPGALLVSRLRPYLRQIGHASHALFASSSDLVRGEPLGCSTEFSVLVSSAEGESLAFLLPFLLSPAAQVSLSAGQEGGHHPRVPRETLLSLRVPDSRLRGRRAKSDAIEKAAERLYGASERYRGALGLAPPQEGSPRGQVFR
jgi:hypothetical protein